MATKTAGHHCFARNIKVSTSSASLPDSRRQGKLVGFNHDCLCSAWIKSNDHVFESTDSAQIPVNPPTSNPTRLAIYFRQLWTIRVLATWHWDWGLHSSPRQPSSADEFISTVDANKPLMWTFSLICMRFFRQGEIPLTNFVVVCRWFQAQVHVGRAEAARTAVTKAFHEELVNGCLGDRSGAICSNQSAKSNARRTSSAQKRGASTGSGKGSCHRYNAGGPSPCTFQICWLRKTLIGGSGKL